MARKPDARQQVLALGPSLLLGVEESIAARQREAVEIGRDLYLAGMSWADVGRLLGVSRQAARQRFGPGVAEWLAVAPAGALPWDLDPAGYDELLAEAQAMADDQADELVRESAAAALDVEALRRTMH